MAGRPDLCSLKQKHVTKWGRRGERVLGLHPIKGKKESRLLHCRTVFHEERNWVSKGRVVPKRKEIAKRLGKSVLCARQPSSKNHSASKKSLQGVRKKHLGEVEAFHHLKGFGVENAD